jgi:hypothetical protein
MRVKSATNKRNTEKRKCIKKFLYYFKKGFHDPKYVSWERGYKWEAHLKFQRELNKKRFNELIQEGNYLDIARIAVNIESRTNLLFSFEKMALRDAVKTEQGARMFAEGLFNYLYGKKTLRQRFEEYVDIIAKLPRKQTRVLTWPLITVFGFIGRPEQHMFLKPNVTRSAAEKYGFDFLYRSRPNWETYQSLLAFAEQVRDDTKNYDPKDYIDLQSFIWVMGSDEYPD